MLFPKLPLLEKFSGKYEFPRTKLSHTVLVCVQHLLETTGSLFEHLIGLGLPPTQMYALGKVYSSNLQVQKGLVERGVRMIDPSPVTRRGHYDEVLRKDVARLWQSALQLADWENASHLVILDDGGYGIAGLPSSIKEDLSVVGIEQTMSGLAQGRPGSSSTIPVIEVASSAAKKSVEPPMICEAIFTKLAIPLFEGNPNSAFGVVGLGNIGRAIATGLLRRRARVFGYDKDPVQTKSVTGIIDCPSIQAVFERSDIVLGCTGTDIISNEGWWKSLTGCKLLISCSSQDREFSSILSTLAGAGNQDALRDVVFSTERGEITLARGGFPANFDGTGESVQKDDIQMTRALLLAAVLQALYVGESGYGGTMLEPEFQRFVVSRWIELRRHRLHWFDPGLIDKFKDLEWIEQNSGGKISRESFATANASGLAAGL
jgi:D-isomer specific 2-hydroxyacid dehydrogenase, NAD binding domain